MKVPSTQLGAKIWMHASTALSTAVTNTASVNVRRSPEGGAVKTGWDANATKHAAIPKLPKVWNASPAGRFWLQDRSTAAINTASALSSAAEGRTLKAGAGAAPLSIHTAPHPAVASNWLTKVVDGWVLNATSMGAAKTSGKISASVGGDEVLCAEGKGRYFKNMRQSIAARRSPGVAINRWLRPWSNLGRYAPPRNKPSALASVA